jgi:hypothetical protein
MSGDENQDDVSDEALAEQEKAMRSLLSAASIPRPASAPDLLPAVQRKIRRRSKGKFFADGWSTSQMRVSYALIAVVMLIVIGAAYVALGPTGISR